MSKRSFIVSISPQEVYEIVSQWDRAELIHQEIRSSGLHSSFATLVFEKYFFRNKSRAGLVVLCDDCSGETEVRLISTGSGDGMIFSFDWGAGSSFVESLAEDLSRYWIRDTDTASD